MPDLLSPYRVLDLTGERGLLCGQMLADLGADVVQVEPPGGSPARRLGPFAGDERDPERSLFWWAYTRNKRGITLDLGSRDGQEILRRLVSTADFLIESEAAGVLPAFGLGYDQLAGIKPSLVYVSITPFGQDGPKADWVASDLVLLAAGGPLYLTGDDDRPPVRVSVPQAYLHAAADGAVGALIAHHERSRSGRGQHVDVSAQQSLTQATQAGILATAAGSIEYQRMSGGARFGPFKLQLVWPCKDGHVSIAFFFGSAIGPFTRRLMEHVHAEGFCDQATRDKDWIGYTELLFSGQEPLQEYERLKKVVEGFTRSKTKEELLRVALERGLLIAPVTTIDEVVESEQLRAREYWQSVEVSEPAGTQRPVDRIVRYPGPFVRLGATPIRYRRRPPRIGEHNGEIYGEELGLSAERRRALASAGVI
jgi:crotonobetainyl-CoA:carnitine CoA-transferase CaiB-like acyl-CoA transferase